MAKSMYDIIKKLDSSRIIDSTSGWYHQTNSDVYSLHVYFRKVVYDKKEIPTIISEFGGYSYKIDEHAYNLDNTYGYTSCQTKEDFENAVIRLYKEEILPFINDGLSASIYTQVSDVEDETNGFFTYDRQILKVDKEKMKELNEAKAKMLYDFLDNSKLFKGTVKKEDRSLMNIPFVTGSEEMDAKFVAEAKAAGFVNLKGHRSVGGMRASIYNAMPVEGVEKLVEFMKKFEAENK